MNVFQIFSDPIRLRIVEILASGEHMSGEISDSITLGHGVSRAAVSKHLAILRREGWVDFREEGSARWYHLTREVWKSLEVEAQWFAYLWARRIGHFSNNVTDPLLESIAKSASPVHTEAGDSG